MIPTKGDSGLEKPKLRPRAFRAVKAALLVILFIFPLAAELPGAQVRVVPRARYRRAVPTGSIAGTVTLADGTPAAGARVMVQTSDGSSPRTTTTDAKGHFRVKNLRRGPYDLRARAGETWSDWKRHVHVRINEETSVTLFIPAPGSAPPPKQPAKKSRRKADPNAP